MGKRTPAYKKAGLKRSDLTAERLAELGKAAYRAAEDTAKRNYSAMKDVMIAHFKEIPGFGPTMKRNYEDKVRPAELRFDPDEWAERYKEAISR